MPTPNFAEILSDARAQQLVDSQIEAASASEARHIGAMQGFKDVVVRSRLDRVNNFEGTHPAVIWGREVGDLTDDFITFMEARDYPGAVPFIDGIWHPPVHRFKWGKDVVAPGYWEPNHEMAGYPLGVIRAKYDVEPWDPSDYPRFIHEHDKDHMHGCHPPRTFLKSGDRPQEWMVFLGEDGNLRAHTLAIAEKAMNSREVVPRVLIRDIPLLYSIGGDVFDTSPAQLLLRNNKAIDRKTDDPNYGQYISGGNIISPQKALTEIMRRTNV